MTHSVYIGSAEGNAGKSTVALGVLDVLQRTVERVGVFRPVSRGVDDYVLEMLLAHEAVDITPDEAVGVSYDDVHADPETALQTIVARYQALASRCDAVVIVGSDYTDVSTPTELGFNARIAANLGAPVLLVLGGRVGHGRPEQLGKSEPRSAHDMAVLAEQALAELAHEHATVFGIVINRADERKVEKIHGAVSTVADAGTPVWVIPEDEILVAPTMGTIMAAVGGKLHFGDPELLNREALSVVVAAMSLNNVLPRLIESSVVVIPADRTEILVGVLTAQAAESFPSVSGIVLNGPFELPEPIERLISGLKVRLPIITTPWGSFDTTVGILSARGRLAAESQRKRDTALRLFEKHVDADALLARLNVAAPSVVTPLMFEYQLFERARAHRKHIVLPEGDDDRILRAAATLLAREVADLTILGEPIEVRSRAITLGLDISRAEVLSPFDAVLSLKFAEELAKLRAHKGMTLERAREIVSDVSYFGTMMVHLGMADGMVSGAAHTTAHTIRPALEIIKTLPGVSIVSSVFFMALPDRVLVYGDCAINPDPTAEELADIAMSSAKTAQLMGVEPRVAMLSYSTGESGAGADVEKVRAATAIVRKRWPDLPIDGPIQYDAAADVAVAASKLPESEVAGRATVFIFPDLNTGNNTYKAVQRSAGAVAIGPVLQGLNKPVNDLSRGALVKDIVNTVAITAIQAQVQS